MPQTVHKWLKLKALLQQVVAQHRMYPKLMCPKGKSSSKRVQTHSKKDLQKSSSWWWYLFICVLFVYSYTRNINIKIYKKCVPLQHIPGSFWIYLFIFLRLTYQKMLETNLFKIIIVYFWSKAPRNVHARKVKSRYSSFKIELDTFSNTLKLLEKKNIP